MHTRLRPDIPLKSINLNLAGAMMLAIAATVLLVASILWHQPWQSVSPSGIGYDTVQPAIVAPRVIAAPDYSELPNWHLFGVVTTESEIVAEPEPEAPAKVDLSQIPETRIPLRLSGIAYAEDQARAFAIIVTPDGQHDGYRAGDEIGDEASVHLVEPYRVVIERNGNFEALSLPDDNARTSSRTTRTVRTPRRPVRRPAPTVRQLEIDHDDDDLDFDPEA